MKTLEEIYLENYIAPVRHKSSPKTETTIERRVMKIQENLINIYYGLKTLYKLDINNKRVLEHILDSIVRTYRKFHINLKTSNIEKIDFSVMDKKQIIETIQGFFSSTNYGLEFLISKYEEERNERMTSELERLQGHLITPYATFDRLIFPNR